jgi:hypothetical protein
MSAQMHKKNLPDGLESQLSGIQVDPARPLLITDADEVLFAFMESFERHLADNGTYFKWVSFRLNGNIIDQATDRPIENHVVRELIGSFFVRHTRTMAVIEGAAPALQRLSQAMDIIVLTNIPHAQRQDRADALAAHGIGFPIISNEGSKAEAVKALAERTTGPVFFIDDAPSHHSDVANVAEHVRRIHFIGDPRLSDLLGPAEASHLRAFDWPEIAAYIEFHLDQTGHWLKR